MATETLHKFVCWEPNRVAAVINKEAVSVDASVFMATHAPFSRIRYLKMPTKLATTSEDDLLQELHGRTTANQHVFAVIQGIPGSGKSHLIRWLKERYAAANRGQGNNGDVVLLIERANNTLRQTLQQILDSGAFDASAFDRQREQLARSASQLTTQGLEATLINNLQVAYVEDKAKGEPSLRANLERDLNDFLLDSTVREELGKPGGPVKRILRFLSAENSRDTGDQLPVFQAQDFAFEPRFLQRLNQAVVRPGVKALVNKMSSEAMRVELVAYLNNLLEFAIGRTTALSSDDLKQMFYDLRRELKAQGRGLALFIEDITAFTGLDTGLIDILITQHTGEGNKEFCRVLSVVGVTDEYYNARFPDNVRDRISHHLSLNEAQSTTTTDLLTGEAPVADLAARYLNAIRLAPDDLQTWYEEGAEIKLLPNKCDGCRVRATCHAAFGAVEVGRHNGEPTRLGLYPFNQTALWRMYQHVDTSTALRTPRTLLNSIVAYVLTSHTQLVREGRFPPRRDQVGSEFGAPTLLNPQQRNLLRAHHLSAAESDRMESMVVFWGDRTLNATEPNGEKLLGGLPQTAYAAFGLPFITGAVSAIEPPPPIIDPSPTTPPIIDPPPPPPQPDDPIITDIENWRTGKKLINYSTLGQALARFVRDALEWDAYDIPRPLVTDRIRQVRFLIEGQDGRSSSRYTLHLGKTDRLINAFYAVHALEGSVDRLSVDRLTSHLTALTVWLAEMEDEIVAFVRAPEKDAQAAPDILDVQLETVTALAVLGGELNVTNTETTEAFANALIKACAAPANWNSATDTAHAKRSSEWARLMRNRQIADQVSSIKSGLLETLNCPQGTSKSVIFINAPTLLDQVQRLKRVDWMLPAYTFEGEGEFWEKTMKARTALAKNYPAVLDAERFRLADFLSQLEELTGGVSGRELDAGIKQFLAALAMDGTHPPAGINSEAKPAFSSMEQTLAYVRTMVDETELLRFAQRVSGGLAFHDRLTVYLTYLQGLLAFAERQRTKWQQALVDAGDTRTKLVQTRTQIDTLYASTADNLRRLTSAGEAS